MDPLLIRFALALGLGMLVGLQRTWSDHPEAGIRTLSLVTILGFISALLTTELGGWTVGAGLLAVTALLVTANLHLFRHAEPHEHGMTTEMAGLVMFGVGALVGLGWTLPAVVVTGTVAVLLHWKDPLHDFAERLGQADFEALIRLVLIALVILPLLPNEDYGPYDVLNPFEIWFMVVLIVGISMAGYVAFKLFGTRAGALAAGLLGGLISSTATTVSYARRTAAQPERSGAAALVITLASTVVFARVIGEIAVVAPGYLGSVVPPLAAMMVLMALLAGVLLLRTRDADAFELPEKEPPSDLKAAIVFGALYAAVLLAVAFAREHLGTGGLYIVAAISGLTDIDAITLSTAALMDGGAIEASTGWRVVLVGALANLVFKGGVVFTLGHPRLRARIAAVFGITLVAGVALLILWPA